VIHCGFCLALDKTGVWQLLTYRGLVNESIRASCGGCSELSEEPCSLESECLHEGACVYRRPTPALTPPSIAKNFGILMGPNAGPSSRKPTKHKQKQSTKKPKKSVLGRQTVEHLDKAALEYVSARRFCTCTPPRAVLIEAALGPPR